MLKSKKRFVLSNETVNSYGFRVLTAGINLERFKRNPLMLWMHKRPDGSNRNEVLPLGYWADIEVINNVIYGTPVFDDTDTFAVSIYNKVENGTINMASAGLIPVEWSDEQMYKITGQNKATLVKSIMDECSLVDIGSNPDALATNLYDMQGHRLNLSSIGTTVNNSVKGDPKEISKMLSEAYNLDKITVDEIVYYKQLAQKDFNGTKSILANMSDGHAIELLAQGKTLDELSKSEHLGKLKQYKPEIYRQKFYEQFGKYPKN